MILLSNVHGNKDALCFDVGNGIESGGALRQQQSYPAFATDMLPEQRKSL